jgi:hypothetical protein
MKKLLAVILVFSSLSSFAVCGVQINNQKSLSSLIGFYELETALQKRGYWLRSDGASDIELELDITFEEIQVCYELNGGIGQELAILWSELIDPPTSVTIKSSFLKTGRVKTDRKGIALYAGSGIRVRKAIRKLIRKVPKCRTKLIN